MADVSRNPREHWLKPLFSKNEVAKSGYTIISHNLTTRTPPLARLSTFETKARVLRGLSYAFLNYQIKVFTTPLRMPFAPLPS